MFREADAIWADGPYMGKGSISVASGALHKTDYVFGAVDIGNRTTPGELLAAAIAGSVSATVALKMTRLGAKPASVSTHATITLQEMADTWRITAVHLDLEVQVSDTDVRCLQEAIQETQAHCPIASDLNLEVSYKTKWIPLGATKIA
jgi:lipoyl-dependent peroxiredoxin